MVDKILNANWQLAERHHFATLPGLVTQQQYGVQDVCPCCMNIVTKETVVLCQNSKTLEFLGYGFPLYYIFVKFTIIMLFTLIVSYSSIGLYWSYKVNSNYCNGFVDKEVNLVRCSSWMVFFSRDELQVSVQQMIIRVSSFLFQLFLLIYIRDILMKTNHYYDERDISPADFSILVQNLPIIKNIGGKIKIILEDINIFRKRFQLVEIVYINQLTKYFQLVQEKQNRINLLKSVISERSVNEVKYGYEQRVSERVDSVQKINEQIRREEEIEKNNIKNDEVRCQKMIIIVNTEEQKEQIIEDFSKANIVEIQKHFGVLKNRIKFSEAAEPREIKWQNINYPTECLIKRRILSWCLFVSVLWVITIIFYFLMIKKSQIAENSSVVTASSLVYVTLGMIVVFNKFVLSFICYKLTDLEKAKTSSQFQFSFAIKYLLGMFFTTAIMTLLVQDLHAHNIISMPFGVVQEESIMFFFSGFLVQVIWIINPWYIYQQIKLKINKGSKLFTQEQANKMMEYPTYSIGKRYAQIIESIWFTYLYSSLIPLGSFLTFLGIIIFYWVDKYNLTRKSSVLSNVSSEICIRALFLLDFTLVMKPLGEIIFDSQIRKEMVWQSYFCLVIGIVYLCLPMNRILQFLHPEPFQLASKTYRESEKDFMFNYRSLHPLNVKEQRVKTMRCLTLKKNFKISKQEIILNIGSQSPKNCTNSQLTKIDDRIPEQTQLRMNMKGEIGGNVYCVDEDRELKKTEYQSVLPAMKQFKKHDSKLYILR